MHGRSRGPAPAPAADDFDADLIVWRDAYAARLAGPDGAWAITGLTWLDQGETLAGSAAEARVRLPAACAPLVATLARDGGRVTVVPAGPCSLWLDGGGRSGPTEVTGPVEASGPDRLFLLGPEPDAARFVVLSRGARRGVRVYDPAPAAARDARRDLAWYPPSPDWRLAARFEPASDGERVPVVNVLGDVEEVPAAGRLRFEHDGAEHALVATWAGERLFVNFRDAGSGSETYAAGRFLIVPSPHEGGAFLDFNRAHHPPCAHTPHATCPLPPLANRLPFVIRAGERLP
jgi:uncharacterized protein